MVDFLDFLTSDSGRVFIAIMAIVISATITITLFVLNRKKKIVTYNFIELRNVISVRKQMASRVRILFDEQPVENVGIVLIRVVNTGTEPIKASDFVRPISFSAPAEMKLLDAAVSKQEPARIDVGLEKDDQKLTIAPLLLNTKEAFVIRLLVSNVRGEFIVDARIEGGELRKGAPDSRRRLLRSLTFGFILSVVTAVISVYVVVRSGSPPYLTIWVALSFLPFLIGKALFDLVETRRRSNTFNDYL